MHPIHCPDQEFLVEQKSPPPVVLTHLSQGDISKALKDAKLVRTEEEKPDKKHHIHAMLWTILSWAAFFSLLIPSIGGLGFALFLIWGICITGGIFNFVKSVKNKERTVGARIMNTFTMMLILPSLALFIYVLYYLIQNVYYILSTDL